MLLDLGQLLRFLRWTTSSFPFPAVRRKLYCFLIRQLEDFRRVPPRILMGPLQLGPAVKRLASTNTEKVIPLALAGR